MKAWINKLVEEEMRFGTEVKKNNFKTVVETFDTCMETVAQNIDDILKSCQQRIVENWEAARLKNSLIFQLKMSQFLVLTALQPPLHSYLKDPLLY